MVMLKNSKLCWLSKIQEVYNNTGLLCKFSSAGIESTKQNEIMMRLSDQFIQDWFNQINKPEGKKGVINLGRKNWSRIIYNLSII